MSEREGNGIGVGVGRRIFALASLAALVLALAGSSRAQAQSAGSKPARAKLSAPKGQQEGITVHGHWTIEVRNPSGKLVTHREFENSLAPAAGPNNGGAWTLESLLLGNYVPLGYQIVLNGNTADQSPPSAPAPCLNGSSAASCTIQENIPPQSSTYPANCPSGSQSIFCALTRTPAVSNEPALSGNPPIVQPLTFQGSFTAPQAGYIGNVALNLSLCSSQSGIPPSPVWPATISPSDCMAGNLVLLHDNESLYQLTATSLSAPVQITAAGMTITASVVLSFQ